MNNILKVSVKDIPEVVEAMEKASKEIERLQKQKEELQINGLRQETLFKLEIERLNNIIDKIEKLCIDNLIYDELGMKVLDQPFILDKIKELKGSDKE